MGAYIKRNADYEASQKEQSQDLFDVMSEHEGQSIVLAESTDVANSHFLSLLDENLVRIPTVMNPELKKKEQEEKERKEKAEQEAKEKEEAEKAAAAEEEKDEEKDDENDEEEEDAPTEEVADDVVEEAGDDEESTETTE